MHASNVRKFGKLTMAMASVVNKASTAVNRSVISGVPGPFVALI